MRTRTLSWVCKTVISPLIAACVLYFFDAYTSTSELLFFTLAWVLIWGLYEIWNTLEDIKEKIKGKY